MSGNVWEYCLDRHGTLAYGIDPKGVSTGALRVKRGGSWDDSANACSSYGRVGGGSSNALNTNGFRLARTLSE